MSTTNMLVLGVYFALIALSCSFDTGDHFEVSRLALAKYNYSADAVATIQVQNYHVDAFSAPVIGLAELSVAHFDNLLSLTQVNSYWAHFSANVKAAVDKAAIAENELHFLSIIGMSLHALQDFYTHSNWVGQHPRSNCDCLRADTWFTRATGIPVLQTSTASGLYDQMPCPAAGEDPKDFSGHIVHGDYCSGENKDSYIRPHYLEAVTHSYAATFEWISIIHSWADLANPGFRAFVKNHVSPKPDDLADDLKFLLPVSELVNTPDEAIDGHWKGYKSGDTSLFATASADWLASSSIYKDVFRDDKLHQEVFKNLYEYGGPNCASPGVDPITVATPTESANGHVLLEIHIHDYDVPRNIFQGDVSPFIIAKVDGVESRTAAFDEVNQDTPDWTLLSFHASSTGVVPIVLTMKDRSSANPYDSDPIEINGESDTINLQYNLATGLVTGPGISGTFASETNLLKISGDEATLHLWFATYDIGGCVPTGAAASCSRRNPQTIISRDEFCQRSEKTIEICVVRTTETSVSCKASMDQALAETAFMDEYDIVTQGCAKACNGTGVQYEVVVYGPEDATLRKRIDSMVQKLESNSLPGFVVLDYNSGSFLAVSLNLVLSLAVFWHFF